MTLSLTSTFDVLHLTRRVDCSSNGARIEELHAIAYLACILSVFDDQPADSWGYGFAATGSGAPFSATIGDAVESLAASGLLESTAGSYRLSPRGEVIRMKIETHLGPSLRLRYLDAAASTTLAMAVPTVTEALMKDPQLRGAITRSQRRNLLDNAGIALLRPHFNGLRSVSVLQPDVGSGVSLFAAAVLWLRYLRAEALQA